MVKGNYSIMHTFHMMITEKTMSKNLKEQQQLESKNTEQNREMIDDCFYVEEKKYGLWDSYDKDGKCIITALNEEECVRATRFYLKGQQEGWPDSKTYSTKDNYKL